MASLLQKLLRKPSPTRFITALNNPQAPIFSAPLPLLQTHVSEATSSHLRPSALIPSSSSPCVDEAIAPRNPQIYPSFSFGFFLNPNSSTGLLQSDPEDAVSGGDSNVIWADSVKKKRKKKMNKHKLRKLRKRLRQKS